MEREDYRTLYKDQSGTVTSLQEEVANLTKALEQQKVNARNEQIKASAMNAFSQNGVNQPDHLLKLIGENLRMDENGAVVALSGGVQVPLQQHIENLRSPGSGFELYFNGTQARGMSASGSGTTTAGGKTWSSMSFTEKVMLEEQDKARGTNEVARLKAAG